MRTDVELLKLLKRKLFWIMLLWRTKGLCASTNVLRELNIISWEENRKLVHLIDNEDSHPHYFDKDGFYSYYYFKPGKYLPRRAYLNYLIRLHQNG